MHTTASPLSYPRLIRVLVALLALMTLLIAAPPTASAKACAAANFIVSAGQAYDRAARSGSAAALAGAMDRYSDMRSIAVSALGRYRKALPGADEAEYVRLTKAFMGRFMLRHGKGLRVGTLAVIDCSGPASNTLVKARTSGGEQVSFRVYQAGGGYRVRDMNVQGIWLVQRMRSTFVGTLQRTNGNFRELYKFLKRD